MEVQYLSHATALVEDGDTQVLCDPWLTGRTYYGSWGHYPVPDPAPGEFDDVDYIYLSHIHPDHIHEQSLEALDSDIPVLVHDFQMDFLKRNAESLGFDVIELPHDERTHLDGDLHINIFGADDCDPEVCGKYFGCSWWMESVTDQTNGSTQIDSLAVFDNGESTMVNANDCRWPLSQQACARISDEYPSIDHLLVQFSAANFYPQCMADYTHEEKLEAAEEVKAEMIEDGLGFVRALEPDYYTPFGMDMVLAGKRAHLNEYLASPEKAEVAEYVEETDAIDSSAHECVPLNSGAWFDVDAGTPSQAYEPVDLDRKREYVESELAGKSFTYEDEPSPSRDELETLIDEAYDHFEEQRQSIGYESETEVLLSVADDEYLSFRMDGDGGHRITNGDTGDDPDPPYVKIDLDPRLFHQILRGPRYAHFDNAQIGSHLLIEKEPDVYERPLYYCLSFLHA